MKRLTTYLNERLVVNKNYNPYTCVPKSWKELRNIIEQRYKERGPGTKQGPINFNDIDVSNIDSFYNGTIGIFEGTKFEYIDITDWYTLKVKNMSYMFYGCENLKSVGDLSNWNVSNVEKIHFIFYKCKKLTSVGDLSNWNVSKIENMINMFYECEKLKSIGDLSNWNVSNVKEIRGMFLDSAIKNKPSWYGK